MLHSNPAICGVAGEACSFQKPTRVDSSLDSLVLFSSGRVSERRCALRMGLCLGTEITEEKKARLHSAKIDRDLYEYAKREMNVVKILLLGETDMILT